MAELKVACVWTGQKYSIEHVQKLQRAVARHLRTEHNFVVLTDNNASVDGAQMRDVSHLQLPGWWAKMALFSPTVRGPGRCLYFDLDTVICGDLGPLAEFKAPFGICENFTRLSGNTSWPCRYGSCVMSFADGWGASVWATFNRSSRATMEDIGKYGDQMAIERLVPGAALLQRALPPGYFVGYRDIGPTPPEGASIVVFAGRSKPENCTLHWVRKEWQ
jgi:hypothetical protein